MPTIADPQAAAQHFVDAALAQRGDKYVFGAEADPGDANPTAFDRSELTQWAAHQAGIEIPDGSAAQYLDLKAKGLLIPVEQAAHTPGALLFTFSSEPTAGGERPTTSHVAISQGNGQTVEADDVQGVTTMDVGSRFQYAAVLPGLQGVTATAAPAAVPAATTVPVTNPAPAVVDPAMVLPGYQIDPGVDISDPNADSDNDGLTNHFESMMHSNPTLADSDLDGLIDGFEASLGTDPMKMDTDLDGMTDGMEVHFGANPLVAAPDPTMGSPLGSRWARRWGRPLPAEPDAAACPTTTMRSGSMPAQTSTSGPAREQPRDPDREAPATRTGGICRGRRLEGPLLDSSASRLGLVVAPPGSGKTTLLARVAAALDRSGRLVPGDR